MMTTATMMLSLCVCSGSASRASNRNTLRQLRLSFVANHKYVKFDVFTDIEMLMSIFVNFLTLIYALAFVYALYAIMNNV